MSPGVATGGVLSQLSAREMTKECSGDRMTSGAMNDLFLIAVVVVTLQGILSLFSGWRHWRYVRALKGTPIPPIRWPVAVILPCRGVDNDFRDNLRALIAQDYPDFQLVCVVESRSDPASEQICRVVGETGAQHVHRVEAGRAERRGQKVHNLLAGLDYVERELAPSRPVEVYVFADSDGRVGRHWLRFLVASLDEQGVGATTGYRWYRAGENFWTLLRSLWNASILTALGPHRGNFAWGGATAIRRETAVAVRLREAWQGALSDDYALTHAVKATGRWIKFVPAGVVLSSGGCSFRELMEFTTRQITITKVYAPRLWFIVGVTNLLFTAVFLWTVGMLLGGILTQGDVIGPAIAAGLIYLPGVAKGMIRVRAVGQIFPDLKDELHRYRWAYWLLHPLVSLLYTINMVASAFRREITWRGIRYRLLSRTTTLVMGSSGAARGMASPAADGRSTARRAR